MLFSAWISLCTSATVRFCKISFEKCTNRIDQCIDMLYELGMLYTTLNRSNIMCLLFGLLLCWAVARLAFVCTAGFSGVVVARLVFVCTAGFSGLVVARLAFVCTAAFSGVVFAQLVFACTVGFTGLAVARLVFVASRITCGCWLLWATLAFALASGSHARKLPHVCKNYLNRACACC